MNYVGIDWAYGRAAWCARSETGRIAGEGLIPAEESGLARLVLELGTEVEACVEMMSGAVWVRDRLQQVGWQVKTAHARKVRDVAPLACKTDKVDARVLAELCRRDLVPEVWVPSLEDRALRERPRRRAHLVKVRTSARNRIFGLLTQFGLRISYARLRGPEAIELLRRRGVPEVWRASIAELLELAEGWTGGSTRSTASSLRLRAQTSAPGCWRRSRGSGRWQPHLRRRDRRGLPLPGARQADRLRRPCPEGEPVGGALGDRGALQGRITNAALGGGRGPPTRPGGPPTPGTPTTCGSPPGTARTRPSRRSPASS